MKGTETILGLVQRTRELLTWRLTRAWAMCPEDMEFETLVPQLCDALEASVIKLNMTAYRAHHLARWEQEIAESGDNIGEEFALAVTLLRKAHNELEIKG